VLAGGGNTSYKDAKFLYVKPSGVALADIREADFVKMDRETIRKVFSLSGYADTAEREAMVTKLMAFAVSGSAARRPSVEAPLHELMPFTYIVHLHPAAVNGLSCAKNGREECGRLFPDALWIPETDPGFILAKTVYDASVKYEKEHGKPVSTIFLQNHGVFVAAETPDAIAALYDAMIERLRQAYAAAGVATDLACGPLDEAFMMARAPRVRTLLGSAERRAVVSTDAPYEPAHGPLTPDHIVYARSFALECSGAADDLERFQGARGYLPKVLNKAGQAVFCVGESLHDARAVAIAARDAGRVQQLAAAFGGARFLTPEQYGFIENWEVESYRRQVRSAGRAAGRLQGRVCVVTGGAQGFGLGIAQLLAAEGAVVVVADLNREGAERAAAALCEAHGPDRALAVAVNIADEASVAAMVGAVVRECGGMDLFVANAGVLKAGSVKVMTRAEWDLVTTVNYTGYFLCVKHASPVMAAQNLDGRGPWTDIVQINSKSGLEGSNRNGAYAGSKFGTIGLTQSFAKELVEDRIKVNSICPGNFFDGPLWSDPEKGLFVQYLSTGKVPGARTIEDVRRAYEAKVPMGRGCRPEDVVRAILYCVEQEYETGQAIPVTGGQVMLN